MKNFYSTYQRVIFKAKYKFWKENEKMKNAEKNAVAKLGYTVTMVVVATAILICMKKYKEW